MNQLFCEKTGMIELDPDYFDEITGGVNASLAGQAAVYGIIGAAAVTAAAGTALVTGASYLAKWAFLPPLPPGQEEEYYRNSLTR
ncbi:hypothetical protein [Acetobacter sp.]|jgi:hypothetical protein|uniref:hypothetical protein n=1 Tax=Acetobacter sp. TaxID=440 RepID=UPI0025C32D85|nr:hypothetical protein [Acetobacter sp.]MCH4092119.1 hypothetical protein [Acetobacter sp.]MCI1299964.1 hypothetical protein [Acetobacter sp.]MCI1315982.1 hypothetical protein [Acetobacter sp.]